MGLGKSPSGVGAGGTPTNRKVVPGIRVPFAVFDISIRCLMQIFAPLYYRFSRPVAVVE